MTGSTIAWPAVLRGAAVALAILVPPIAVIRAWLGNDDDSPLWSVVPVAFVVAFPAGGFVAARRVPATPFLHGATAAAAAFAVALVFGIARNLATGWSMGVAALVTAVLFWQIATALGVLGAFIAARRARITSTTGAEQP